MLYYKEWGAPHNPLLIFLHGFLGTHEDFIPIINHLKNNFHCVAFDLPGHGHSSTLPFNNTSDIQTLILRSLSPFNNIPYTLIGYSMGGRIALSILKDINCSSLILISASFKELTIEQSRKREIWEKEWLDYLTKENFSLFLEKWYAQPLFSSIYKRSFLLSSMIKKRSLQNPSSLSKVFTLLSPIKLKPSISLSNEFDLPLLYIAGENDDKYVQYSKDLKERNAKAWISIISGSSHCPHVENPLSVSNIIHKFGRFYHGRMEIKR